MKTQFTDKTLVWIKADCKASLMTFTILTKSHVVQHKTPLRMWIFFSEHSCGLLKNETKKTEHMHLNTRWLTPASDTGKNIMIKWLFCQQFPRSRMNFAPYLFTFFGIRGLSAQRDTVMPLKYKSETTPKKNKSMSYWHVSRLWSGRDWINYATTAN